MISNTSTTLTIGRSRLPNGMPLWKAGKDIRSFVRDHAPRGATFAYNAPLTFHVTFKHDADAVLFKMRYCDWLSTTAAEMRCVEPFLRRVIAHYKPEYDALSAEGQIAMMMFEILTLPLLSLNNPPMYRFEKKLLVEGMGWIATEAGWKHPSEIQLAA